MLRLKPISEKQAIEVSGQVHEAYEDIKKTLDAPGVPLVFQYIANFEEYFLYLWGKIKVNITTSYFESAVQEAATFTNTEIASIYSPSSRMAQFIHQLHPQEKEQITKTVTNLQMLNAKLLVITIALREGVKGVIIGEEQMVKIDTKEYEVDIFDIFHTKYATEQKEIEPASRMLAPLFGNQGIALSQYPIFFGTVAREMDGFIKKEQYLWKRVELERVGMRTAMGLPYSIGCSYQEIMAYAGHRPHLHELIYILAETFPSQFPRLLITTSVMRIALEGKFPLATT